MAESRCLQVWYRRFRPSVLRARAEARVLAREWGLPGPVADSLEWVVTELLTNAVIHGRTMRGSHVVVGYHLDGDRLRVEVRDAASGMPELVPLVVEGGDEPEGGRGLQIVAALADAWGVTPRVIGKTVWAELNVSSKEGAT
ncbi:Histidine kinase-like ATPase domain-containing protein [Streptomyces sp. yr375]|uniref:ATP-binding protein n=1 Tax=Streptomyces sp. yr375 TaxID=1761906 RepID=UPI0008B2D9B7|nr:ATP-binding protein [Streptomyces sp. yr375]SES34951.1 Histidine kinase-like ATPase domain-containing protein [Streptomyces sp. yr375]